MKFLFGWVISETNNGSVTTVQCEPALEIECGDAEVAAAVAKHMHQAFTGRRAVVMCQVGEVEAGPVAFPADGPVSGVALKVAHEEAIEQVAAIFAAGRKPP